MMFFCYAMVVICTLLGLWYSMCICINHIRGRRIKILYIGELSENESEYKIRSYLKSYPNADIVVKGYGTAEDIIKRLSFSYERVKIKK